MITRKPSDLSATAVNTLVQAVQSLLREATDVIQRTDQRALAVKMLQLDKDLSGRPGEFARAVLALYEGPRARGSVLSGDYSLDSIGLYRNGDAFTANDPVLWAETLRYGALRSELYGNALRLWQSCDFARIPLPPPGEVEQTLLEDTHGSRIVRRGGTYFALYDTGRFVSEWHEVEITRCRPSRACWARCTSSA